MIRLALSRFYIVAVVCMALVGCYDTVSPIRTEAWLTISNVDGSDKHYIRLTEGTPYFIPAPDGEVQNILLVKQQGFEIIDQQGNTISDLYADTENFHMNDDIAFSSDGSMFAFTKGASATENMSDIYLGHIDGSELVPIAYCDSVWELQPSFSLSNDCVFYKVDNPNGDLSRLSKVSLQDLSVTTIDTLSGDYEFRYPQVVYNGDIVVTVYEDLFTGYLFRTSENQVNQVSIFPEKPNNCRLSLSQSRSDGAFAVGSTVYKVDFTTNAVTATLTLDASIANPLFSDDLRYLAYGQSNKSIVSTETGDTLLQAENGRFIDFCNENKVIYSTIRKFQNGEEIE